MRRSITIVRLGALIICCLMSLAAQEEDGAQRGRGREAREGRGTEAWQARRQEREWQRLVEARPELQGIDPSSPEGQAALAQARSQRMEEMGEQMRSRMAEQQQANNEALRVVLGFDEETFTAVAPLLDRVSSLRLQEALITAPTNPIGQVMPRGRGRGPQTAGDPAPQAGGGPGRMAALLLSDDDIDPAVAACQQAASALSALIEDPQASDDEIAAAVIQLRAARQHFAQIMAAAQEELRSVMTPRQEAILLGRGILD